MYCHEHNDDYKFSLMWFLDITDEVHNLTHEENGGDVKGISSVCDLVTSGDYFEHFTYM